MSNQSNAVIKLHLKIYRYKENMTFYNGVTSLNAAFDDNSINGFQNPYICSKEHNTKSV